MINGNPLVSIIIPVFNRADLVAETLDSVLTQTYLSWECIVVDDGSTDTTEDVLKKYVQKDQRFRFYKRPVNLPKGANSCRNHGFSLSKGDYIQWLDSDDVLGRDKLLLQVEALKKNPNTAIAICKFGYFLVIQKLNVRGEVKTYRDFEKGLDLLKSFGQNAEYFPPHVFLTKRVVIEKAGVWNEAIEINQDGEFFTRILLEATKVKYVNTAVYYRSTRNDNVSLVTSSIKAQKLIDCWKLIQQHISLATGSKKHIYVETAKNLIHKKIKDEYPEVVMNNAAFFRSIQPFYKRILNLK